MAAARKRTALQQAARGVLKALDGVHPSTALERLAEVEAGEGPGFRRRVLLAARIGLLRKALEAPALPPALQPVEMAEPALPPEPTPPPPEPKPPKPLSKGTMMSVSLEDAAKLLLVAPPEEEAAAPDGPGGDADGADGGAEDAAGFVPAGWIDAAAQIDAAPTAAESGGGGGGGETVILDDLDAAVARLDVLEDDSGLFPDDPPAAAPAKKAKAGGKGRTRRAEVPGEDLAALAAFAALPAPGALPAGIDVDLAALAALDAVTDATVAEDPPAGMLDPSAAFAALAAAEEAEARAIAPPVKAGIMDQVAALVALDEPGPVVMAPPQGMVDPAAAFAALAAEEVVQASPKGRPAPMIDPAAALAALSGEDDTPVVPPPKARPAPAVDAAAAFAALDAARDDEVKAIAAVGSKPKPLSIDLSAQFAAMGRDDAE